MGVIVVCQQPNYFPWLGYLEQCARSDLLILLDSVQWIRSGWQSRARILQHKNADSDYQWLTIPLYSRSHRSKKINELKIVKDSGWAERHWKTLSVVYGGRPYFKSQLVRWIQPWYERAQSFESFCEASVSSLNLCLEILGLKPRIYYSSAFEDNTSKTERLVSLCKSVGANVYYSGLASTKYIDPELFRNASIQLMWQHFRHPEYDQGRTQFKSHLSFLDVLANCDVEQVKQGF